MSQIEFERFRQVVLTDELLQEHLRSVIDGNAFRSRVVELATERGFVITAEDVSRAMGDGHRAWIERWIR